MGQLAATFDVLGTPTETTWPTVSQMPDYGKLQFTPKPPQPLETVIPRAKEVPGLIELLEQLVVLNPSNRLPSQKALDSDLFPDDYSIDRQRMHDELIPPNLPEPLLLSNPNGDVSIASRKALELAATKRGFLKSFATWKDSQSSMSIAERCNQLSSEAAGE